MVPNSSRDTILIITDNVAYRLSLAKDFREAGYKVLTASEEPSIKALREMTPSLVVADSQACSIDKLRQRKVLKTTAIIALNRPNTSSTEDDDVDALERGADLVLSNQTTKALIARVRAVLRRTVLPHQAILECTTGGVHMDLERHEVHVRGKLIHLTRKEFLILRSFLESPNRVFSRDEMLNSVWGEGYALEQHAVDVHIHSLRQKIEETPAQPKLILTVRGIGYRYCDAP